MDITSPSCDHDGTPEQTAGIFGFTGCLLLLGWIYLCLEFNETLFLIVIICQVAWCSTFWSFWESEFWRDRNSPGRNPRVRVVVDYGPDHQAGHAEGRNGVPEVRVERRRRKFDTTFGEEMEDLGVWFGEVKMVLAQVTVADLRKRVVERWRTLRGSGAAHGEGGKGNTGWKKMV